MDISGFLKFTFVHFSNGRINVYHNKLKPEITFFDNKPQFEVGELFNQKMLLLYSTLCITGATNLPDGDR